MHRIDGPGHVGNLFSPGNPAGGVRATTVTSDWLNDIQETLVRLIERAGIEPLKGDYDQLWEAFEHYGVAAGLRGYDNAAAMYADLNWPSQMLAVLADDPLGTVYRKSGAAGAGEWIATAMQLLGPQGLQGLQGIQGPVGPEPIGVPTLADLTADLTPDDGVVRHVTNDPTATNNGTWRKSGASGTGSWIKASNDLMAQALAAADNAVAAYLGHIAAEDPHPMYAANGGGTGTNVILKLYPSAPAAPPINSFFMVAPVFSAVMTEPAGGTILAAGTIAVAFDVAVNPATVTHVGNGTGSFEVYNVTADAYITGDLSTTDNRTYTFAPGAELTEGDTIQVRIAVTVTTTEPILGYDGAIIALFVAPPDLVAPVVTAFAIPASGSSLTVPITTLTATDAAGVTGYMITESATPPASDAAGWTPAPPATYLVTSDGAHTLYGWAKDAAGLVSNSMSDSITIVILFPIDFSTAVDLTTGPALRSIVGGSGTATQSTGAGTITLNSPSAADGAALAFADALNGGTETLSITAKAFTTAVNHIFARLIEGPAMPAVSTFTAIDAANLSYLNGMTDTALYIVYDDNADALQYWNGSGWSTTPTTSTFAGANFVTNNYRFNYEVTATQFRIVIKSEDGVTTHLTTAWVDWSNTKRGANPVYYVAGDLYNDAHNPTLIITAADRS